MSKLAQDVGLANAILESRFPRMCDLPADLAAFIVDPNAHDRICLADKKHSCSLTNPVLWEGAQPISSLPSPNSYGPIRKKRRNRGDRKHHWCVTAFKKDIHINYDCKDVLYCMKQLEVCDRTGREHWQIYIEFRTAKRIKQVQRIIGDPHCHCEKRTGSRDQAREYCRKKDTQKLVDGKPVQHEFGIWRENNHSKPTLSDMLATDMNLEDLIIESPVTFVYHHRGLQALYNYRDGKTSSHFRKIDIYVYIGPTGCGKTRRAVAYSPDHFKLNPADTLWFDGYRGQKVLIIDDFNGGIKYRTLLTLCDGYAYNAPVKYGFVWAKWTTIIFTSNVLVQDWYQNKSKEELAPLHRRISTVIHMGAPVAPRLNFIDLST